MQRKIKAKMKLVNCLAFAIDMLSERWRQLVLVVFMGTVSFGLVDLCIMLVLENQRTYLQAEELFHADQEMVYKISDGNLANILNNTRENLFEKELIASEAWSRICTFGFSDTNAFEELSQNPEYVNMMTQAYAGTLEGDMMAQENYSPGDEMRVCIVNQNALTLFGIHLPEAVRPEKNVDNDSGRLVPIYAGSQLQNMLKPGQVLTSPYIGLNSEKNPDGISLVSYYVAGYLKPNTLIMADNYMGNSTVAACLDTMILICHEDAEAAGFIVPEGLYTDNLYAVLSKEELWDFQYVLRQIYENHSKKLIMRTIKQLIRENNTDTNSLRILVMLAILLTFSGFLAFLTTSITSTLLRGHQFVIMLANGISHRDIRLMITMETAMKYLISLLVSFCLMHSIYYINSMYYVYTGINYQMTYLHMHLQYVLPLLVVLCILGIIIAVLASNQPLKRLWLYFY